MALVVLEAAVLCRMESVAVTVSGGGTTAGPVHLTEIRNYLHLTVSQSFSSPFRPSFAVFACTSHESPCVMSSLISPPLYAHLPYCIYPLSGPRLRLLLPSSGPRLRLHLPSSGPRLPLLLSSPGSKCPSSLEPQFRLPKNPRSVSPFSTFCILPRIEYSSLQFHFDIQQNDISSNVIIMY